MEKNCNERKHSHSFLAWVLIVVGLIWLLKKSGWEFHLPWIHEFAQGGSLHAYLIPILILGAGLGLIAGRRFFGALILIALVLFLLPHLIIIPGLLLFFFLPVLLLVAGIIILSKIFF